MTEGTVTRTVYDDNGRAEYTVDRHVPGQPTHGTRTIYDALGRVVETQRRSGVVIDIVDDPNYPGLGIKTAQLTDAGTVFSNTATEYDAAGRVIASTGADGETTEFEYDAAGRQTAVIDALNNRTEYDYDAAGRRIMVIDALDRETHFRHDELGRVVETIRHDLTTTQTVYNTLGNRIAEIDPLGLQTDYEYDLLGNLTAVELPEVTNPDTGQPERPRYEYEYDDFGNQTVQRDALGRETTYTHDAFGNRLTRTLPEGQAETAEFNDLGQLIRQTDFIGRIVEYEYDGLGRVEAMTYFSPGSDPQIDPPDETTVYEYDDLGRRTAIKRDLDGDPGTWERLTGFDYDLDSRMIQVDSPEGVINYEYDEATGRHTRTWTGTDEQNPDTDTGYDHDALGRLETVTAIARNGQALPAPEVTTYAYNPVGAIDTITLPNGVVSDYEYDDLHRLVTLTHTDDQQNVLASFEYTLREDGMRIGVTETDHEANVTTVAWDYDNLGRLIEEVYDSHDPALDYTATYTFDLVGNRLEKQTDEGSDGTVEETITYVYDDNDQLLTETLVSATETDTTTTYEYGGPTNPGVERTRKLVEETSGGAVVEETNHEYNLQGRLARVEIDATGDGTTDTEVEYTYDDTGIRVRRTKDGQSTLYLVDKNNPTGFAQVLEEIANDNIVRSYTIGLRILAQHDASSVARYLLADGHGSTRLLVDALGAPISGQLFRYDAYGNPIGFDPAAALTAHLYAGEWRDAAVGLDYLRDRWLDPAAGRFTQMDRFEGVLANPLTLHKLLYVHGNPLLYTDPSGEMALVATLGRVLISSVIVAAVSAVPVGAVFLLDATMARGVTRGVTPWILLNDPAVNSAMRQAYVDSNMATPSAQEQGGTIVDKGAGSYGVVRWAPGTQGSIVPPHTPSGMIGLDPIVGSFHTHPNVGISPQGGPWEPQPSPRDLRLFEDHPETFGDVQFVLSAHGRIYVIERSFVFGTVKWRDFAPTLGYVH